MTASAISLDAALFPPTTLPMDASAPDPGKARLIEVAAKDAALIRVRREVADLTVDVFGSTGRDLHVLGWIIGTDRSAGESPFGNGSDETVAVGMLLRIAQQLVGGSITLIQDSQTYAAAALIRQLVEIEYLAWAIDTRDRDGERWLRSDRKQRETFFTPGKLRQAANGKFRGKDYGYHCELGGHPTPRSRKLLDDDGALAQLFLADCLGHSGRIWDHLVSWAHRASLGEAILKRQPEMLERYMNWKSVDPLAALPAPP